ncbi:MAG: hypothetical protein LBL94_07290 [Prevotellaceae bacterium]|jgi:hypothetical protein|nr:hypothetical protein [Prevotellaceae bacterium]
MMKKTYLFAVVLLCFASSSVAQNESEGLRFSRTTHLGTARFAAMGGAFAALGGDAGAIAFNPAGIGVYRSNEFTITGNLLSAVTDVTYMGQKSNDYRYNFGLSNIAAVGVYNFGDDEGLISMSFGFSFNRTNNFAQRYAAVGRYQNSNTYLDYFAMRGTNDGNLPGKLRDNEAYMAYKTYLINHQDSTKNIYFPSLVDGDETQVRQYTELSGSLSTYDFSFGGNVSNVAYFGVGIGISAVEFNENNTASEYAAENNKSEFRNFSYNKKFEQRGVGYNFKFGVIAWPFVNADVLNGLRLGAAVHTRTFLNMNDEYSANIVSNRTFGSEKAWVDPNKFFYNIETPTRIMGGLAYVFSGSAVDDWRGILSADYEYVDYSSIKLREERDHPALSPDDPHYNVSNANIKEFHKGTHNVRLGGELGYKNIAFRLGYAYYDNPYTDKAKKDGTINIFSGGLGLQISSMFNINLTYSLTNQKDKEYMYYAESQVSEFPNIISEAKEYTMYQSNFFISLGWRF